MQQDIRDLFGEEADFKTLPKKHRTEFLDKLQQQPKGESKILPRLRIAAVAIIVLTIGFTIFYNAPNKDVSPMITQIEFVKAEYLENIEKEWENFVAITSDEVLVERIKKRLDELDKDCQEILSQFKKDSNNILVIEALIENLQTRLRILKDIQEHIKILNQKKRAT